MYAFVVVAALIALYFVAASFQRPRPAAYLAALLWSAYAVYEYFVANGTLCDANCNIRVDLVLFLPILGLATWLALGEKPRNGAVATLAVVCLVLIAGLGSVFGSTAITVIATITALAIIAIALRTRFRTTRV